MWASNVGGHEASLYCCGLVGMWGLTSVQSSTPCWKVSLRGHPDFEVTQGLLPGARGRILVWIDFGMCCLGQAVWAGQVLRRMPGWGELLVC